MEFEYSATHGLPVGTYVGRFVGCRAQDDGTGTQKRVIGRNGKPLPLGAIWEWSIVGGAHDGETADRLTGKDPGPRSMCAGFIQAVTGQPFAPGTKVRVNDFSGTLWRLNIELKESGQGTRVALAGLSRAYDLERPAGAAAGQHMPPPPPDDDDAEPAAPAEPSYYVMAPGRNHVPVTMSRSEVMAGIAGGKVTKKYRVCPVGGAKWSTAEQLFPDPDLWGPD